MRKWLHSCNIGGCCDVVGILPNRHWVPSKRPIACCALAGMSMGGATDTPNTSHVGYNPAAAAAAQWAGPMRAACMQGYNDTQGSLVGAPATMVRMSTHQLLVTVPVECLGVRHPTAILHVTSVFPQGSW